MRLLLFIIIAIASIIGTIKIIERSKNDWKRGEYSKISSVLIILLIITFWFVMYFVTH